MSPNSSRVAGPVFSRRHHIQALSKKACVKENEHVYLFSLCFSMLWKFSFLFSEKSSDYCDGVSVKLKYLKSYDYISNPVLFIISLEDSHFESRGNMLVSHQKKS